MEGFFMFHWKNKKKEKHDEEQHDYALTFDNKMKTIFLSKKVK